MKNEKLYDVVCSKSDPYSDTEPYTRTVGTKLPLKEAQQAMIDDALYEIKYNGHIYVGKDGEEFEYIDFDNLKENVTKYLKRHSIGRSMNIAQWNGEEIDYSIVEHKEPVKEPAQTEIWTVSSAEFNGWDNKLDTCSSTFTSKQDAIDWVNRNYESVMEDFFGQDPDADVDMELGLKESDFGFGYTVRTPDCENHYHTWNITGTVFHDLFKKV